MGLELYLVWAKRLLRLELSPLGSKDHVKLEREAPRYVEGERKE